MATDEVVQILADFALFADLSPPQLEKVAHTFEEQWFSQGQRILRQSLSGSGFHIILEGEASVVIDGTERNRLGRGEFFGELSVLLQQPPSADVVALTPLRCLVLPGPQLHDWLLEMPSVTFRMLHAELRRLNAANRWSS